MPINNAAVGHGIVTQHLCCNDGHAAACQGHILGLDNHTERFPFIGSLWVRAPG
ncbi:MAG: hypothetical protein ACREMA_16675 [Longimicrobiales bacterium]